MTATTAPPSPRFHVATGACDVESCNTMHEAAEVMAEAMRDDYCNSRWGQILDADGAEVPVSIYVIPFQGAPTPLESLLTAARAALEYGDDICMDPDWHESHEEKKLSAAMKILRAALAPFEASNGEVK